MPDHPKWYEDYLAEAREQASNPPTFFERRAARDPSIDHASHSQQWVGACPECPTDLPAEPAKEDER